MLQTIDEVTAVVIDASLNIHRKLGPGLLESVYHTVLSKDLERRGVFVESHRTIAFDFEGITFTQGLCVDLLIDHRLVVELKSVEKIAPVHYKQVLSYLKLLHLPVGLLLNFGAATMKEGIHRIVNNYIPGASGFPSPPEHVESTGEVHGGGVPENDGAKRQ